MASQASHSFALKTFSLREMSGCLREQIVERQEISSPYLLLQSQNPSEVSVSLI